MWQLCCGDPIRAGASRGNQRCVEQRQPALVLEGFAGSRNGQHWYGRLARASQGLGCMGSDCFGSQRNGSRGVIRHVVDSVFCYCAAVCFGWPLECKSNPRDAGAGEPGMGEAKSRWAESATANNGCNGMACPVVVGRPEVWIAEQRQQGQLCCGEHWRSEAI